MGIILLAEAQAFYLPFNLAPPQLTDRLHREEKDLKRVKDGRLKAAIVVKGGGGYGLEPELNDS